MAIKKRWTEDEDNLLLSSIEDNPDNLTQVFKEVGKKLGRSDKAVSGHWYASLSKGKMTVFMTIAKKKYSRNRKQGKMEKKSCASLWQKILKFFGI